MDHTRYHLNNAYFESNLIFQIIFVFHKFCLQLAEEEQR